MPDLVIPDGFPLPGLIARLSPDDTMVGGDPEHYLRVGLSALNVIEGAFAGLPDPRRILDLPCGFGRVTRVLRARYPEASITVCDLDRAGVDFSAAAFNAHGLYSKSEFRDLDLGSHFDLIWVGSLLTHLPEHLTRQFLDFAVRHMGPNSRLVVTSHGDYVATRLRSWTYGLSEPAARGLLAQYLEEGYAYRGYGGNPDYGISLVAHTWYESALAGSPLRLRSYQRRGWDDHQDVVVMQLAAQDVAARPRATGTFFQDAAPRVLLSGAAQAAQDEAGVAGFDEEWYCKTFDDVAAAIRRGEIASGSAHYMDYGWKEGRPPFDPRRSYLARTPRKPSAWSDGDAPETIA